MTGAKQSIEDITKSLKLDRVQAEQLREATLRWLGKFCVYDDEKTAQLSSTEIEKQARAFVYKSRSKVLYQIIASLAGPSRSGLVLKIRDIMTRQVHHKRDWLVKRRRKGAVNADVEDDVDSDGTERTIITVEHARHQDEDYEPSNAGLDTPRLKVHNTRLNVHPGMPIRPSIESNQLMRGGRNFLANRTELRAGSVSDDETEIRETPLTATASVIRDRATAQRTMEVEDITTTGTPHQATQTQDDIKAKHSSVCQPVDKSRNSITRPFTPNYTSPVAAHVTSSPSARTHTIQQVTPMLDFEPYFFDRSRPSSEPADDVEIRDMRLLDIEALYPRHPLPSPSLRQSSAGRVSSTEAPVFSTDEFSSRSEDIPRSTTLLENSSSIQATKRRIYFANECKVIPVGRAIQVLQAVVYALEDKNRRLQLEAQKAAGSLRQEECEKAVVVGCDMLQTIRDDRKIWTSDIPDERPLGSV